MAAVPPPQPQPSTTQNDAAAASPLSWEGEKMFNIYIYDYCFKRGFRKTARELLLEAEIPPDSTPPINARQGLLFEWWSVFWVLFQAKSNNGGSEDALLYTQHQQQLQQQRNARAIRTDIPPPQHQPPQMQRPLAPGMINGMSTNHGGQPQIPIGASSMVFSMGGAPGPQVNGVPGSHPPTPQNGPPQGQLQQGPHQGGPGQPGFNMIQQRPPMNGPQPPQQQQPGGPSQPQQRPMANPNLPFQSPTMCGAHSPNAGPGMQGGQGQPGGPQPPMGNLGGMQNMNRSGTMLPPNAGPPHPQAMMMGQHAGPIPAPNQQFSPMNNVGRPPSRTNTPQMQGMMQQSPSMAARHIPDGAVNAEFASLPPPVLMQLKADVGLGDKDPSQLNIGDKRRILQLNAQRRPPNAVAGPSNPGMPPNQQQRPPPQRGGKRSSTSPGEEHETLPRTESSPPDRKRPRRSPQETNPSIPKNMSYPPTPQQGPALPQQQPGLQGQPPGTLQQQPGQAGMAPNNMMMGGRPVQGGPMQPQMMQNGRIPPPAMSMQGQSLSPHPQMQGGQMAHSHMGIMMSNPSSMGQQQYRVPLHQVHMPPQNAGSPAGSDPQFNPGGPNPGQQQPGAPPGGPQFNNTRMMAQKPQHPGQPNVMLPPPSPANAGKDVQGKDIKMEGSPSGGGQPANQQGGPSQPNPGQQQSQQQPNPGGPPQIPPPGTPSQQAQQPQQVQQQQNLSLAPQQPDNNSASSNNMLGGPTSNMNDPLNGLGDPISMFSPDFGMPFDPTSFDGGIDFERDFRQWFNPSEEMALDMK